jgi:hypothetical protein
MPNPDPIHAAAVELLLAYDEWDCSDVAEDREWTEAELLDEWLSRPDNAALLARFVDAVRERDAAICDDLAEHDCDAEQCASTLRARKAGGV